MPGIDVSAIGQGPSFNWSAYKDRIAFAGVKATQGLTFQDPDFSLNMNGAASIGAARMPYHFLDPEEDGAEQARYFLDYAKPQPGELVMLDHETSTGPAGGALAAAAVADRAAAFADHVRAALGAWPVLYTDQYMAENGYCAGLGQQPLFLANPSHVKLPPVIGPWRLVSFEQTGTRGIDTDVFYGTGPELQRLMVLHAEVVPAPAPIHGYMISWASPNQPPKLLEMTSTNGGKTWQG